MVESKKRRDGVRLTLTLLSYEYSSARALRTSAVGSQLITIRQQSETAFLKKSNYSSRLDNMRLFHPIFSIVPVFLSLVCRPLQIRPRIGMKARTLPRIANNRNVNWYPILSHRSTA